MSGGVRGGAGDDPTYSMVCLGITAAEAIVRVQCRSRIAVYPWIIVAAYVIVAGYWLFSKPGLVDRLGKPKGGDFVTFYSASVLALRGQPAAAYGTALFGVETEVTGARSYHTTWNYPPTFLLLVAPFSLLPYTCSLFLWLGGTLFVYAWVVRKFAPHPLATRLILAFTGTFQNFIQGHTGFLTTALLGGGLLLIDSRPFLAGLTLGLLSYKPQLGWLAIIALVAARRWVSLAGAALSAATAATISYAAYGERTWNAFFHNIPIISKALAAGAYPVSKMPTTYAAARLLGAGTGVAMGLQAAVTLAAVSVVWLVWSRRESTLASRASALAVGTCLAFPFIFDYDLAILAIPLACIAWDRRDRAWRSGEKAMWIAVWLLPFACTLVARFTRVQVAPVVLALLLAMALRTPIRREA